MKKLLILLACVTVALSSMAGDIIVKPVFASDKETNWGGTEDDIKANEAYKMKLVDGTQNLYTCTIHLNKYFKTNKWNSTYGETYQDNIGWRNVHSFACVNTDDFGSLKYQKTDIDFGSAISAAQEFTIYNEKGEDVTFYAMVDNNGKVHSYCNKQKLMLNNGPLIGGKPDSDLKISEYFTITGKSVNLKITSNKNYYWTEDKASKEDFPVTTFGVGKATLDLKTFKFTIENNIFDTPLTVTSAGASTLVLPYKATIPEGVKAYTLEHKKGEATAIATELTGFIPANTPVLINAEAGTYNFHGETTAWEKYETTVGALTSVRTCKYVPEGSYVLQNHNGQVGFYKVVKEKPVMIGANRAYLTPSVAMAAAKINIEYPEVTGITSIKDTTIENDVMYNLAGQKVGNDYRGIVIKNGYKFFNK
ncbi:MAG: hypothetical protein PUI72_07615 [Prevotellaceae bacterium]|nr:hypothetical protein [Prevotellaceae bacterium]MDY6200642.1 hypothetical protein [Prevotella sp.]